MNIIFIIIHLIVLISVLCSLHTLFINDMQRDKARELNYNSSSSACPRAQENDIMNKNPTMPLKIKIAPTVPATRTIIANKTTAQNDNINRAIVFFFISSFL